MTKLCYWTAMLFAEARHQFIFERDGVLYTPQTGNILRYNPATVLELAKQLN